MKEFLSREGFLRIGQTSACFSVPGTQPDPRERFTMLAILGDSTSRLLFKSQVGKGSRLHDFVAIDLIILLTSVCVVGVNEFKEDLVLVPLTGEGMEGETSRDASILCLIVWILPWKKSEKWSAKS